MSTQNEPPNAAGGMNGQRDGNANGAATDSQEQLQPIVLPEAPQAAPAAPISVPPIAPTAAAPVAPPPASVATAQPQHQPQAAPTAAQPQAPAAQHQRPGELAPRKLSTFLKVSIILLAALSIASIALLFIGDFEGKFERVFSTFLAFAIFVGLTAFDTRRGQRNEWYPPVALIANSYILALLLIVVWMTPSGWSLVWDIFWKSVVVILVTRAVVACSQLLLNMAEGRPKPLAVFALITSLLATLTGILFTAPIAIDVFDVEVPELYWRFAVAALLLTALGLSISILLRWSYGAPEREAAKQQREAALAAQQQAYQGDYHGQPYFAQQPAALPQQAVAQQVAPMQQPTQQPMQQPVPAAMPQQQVATQQPHSEEQLLPWPTFADGRPLPVGPDGQPDFSALNR